jgi:hemerythrin-like domain-containing protein
MSTDITRALVEEHRLILRMIALLEKKAPLTAAGSYRNWQFYLDGVDFIRNYADRYHHAKEEDVLFEALVQNGMPRENSPVAAMLMEHDHGRAYVAAMEAAAREALEGKEDRARTIADNALAYAELLRGHIEREDGILYPLAERVLPEALRPGIVSGYEAAETNTPADFTERYRAVVERYEAE